MADNLNINETAQAWAEILIKIWRQKLIELDIGYSGELFDSFFYTIKSLSNDNPDIIQFGFNYYGKFVDMGVGRDVFVGNPGDVSSGRKPKPWYSKTFYAQTMKLRELLQDKYGILGASVVSENIRQKSGSSVKSDHQRPLSDLDRYWMQKNGLL
jgi:hypothetical protein